MKRLFLAPLVALCFALPCRASAPANPLATKYPNARALAQALRESAGSKAPLVFWPDAPRSGSGVLLGAYVQPTPEQVKRGARVGTIYLSAQTVNALSRLAKGGRNARDLDTGALTVLHEAMHSIGLCRLPGPRPDGDVQIEEAWAQRAAEVLLSRLMAK